MAPAVTKPKIPHVVQFSAQSEQLCERYSKFNWFLKIVCLRYVNTWGRDCVSGVPPCLVHSQKLSELTGHSYGGQIPYRTAVPPVLTICFKSRFRTCQYWCRASSHQHDNCRHICVESAAPLRAWQSCHGGSLK